MYRRLGALSFKSRLEVKLRTYGVISNATILNEPTVILQHPREFLKVFQQEGKYPKGLVSDAWFQPRLDSYGAS